MRGGGGEEGGGLSIKRNDPLFSCFTSLGPRDAANHIVHSKLNVDDHQDWKHPFYSTLRFKV